MRGGAFPIASFLPFFFKETSQYRQVVDHVRFLWFSWPRTSSISLTIKFNQNFNTKTKNTDISDILIFIELKIIIFNIFALTLVHWSIGPLLVHCWSIGPLVHCWSIVGSFLVHCWYIVWCVYSKKYSFEFRLKEFSVIRMTPLKASTATLLWSEK